MQGNGFIARYITLENIAGPQHEQAVAVLNMANHSIFCQCTFLGYADTLYAKESLQFYRECDIYESRDFIFLDASAVFQNCKLCACVPNNVIIFTAHGRQWVRRNTGFKIQNCSIINHGPKARWLPQDHDQRGSRSPLVQVLQGDGNGVVFG